MIRIRVRRQNSPRFQALHLNGGYNPRHEAVETDPARDGEPGPGEVPVEVPIEFPLLEQKRWPGALSLFLSMVAHSGMVGAAVLVPMSLMDRPEDVPVRVARYEPLDIQVPERLYLSSSPLPKAAAAAPAAKAAANPVPAVGGAPAPPAPLKQDAPPVSTHARATRQFELPESIPRRDSPQTVLQLDAPPAAPQQIAVRLPQLMIWTPQNPKAPRRQFVAPGSPPAPRQPALLDAPPKLENPNRETALSDLKLASAPPIATPALPRIAATTAPLRKFIPPPDQRRPTAQTEVFTGDPVAVVAYSADPAALKERITLPGFNQIGHLPDDPGGASGGDAAGRDVQPGGEARGSIPAGRTGGEGRRDGAGPGSGKGAGVGVQQASARPGSGGAFPGGIRISGGSGTPGSGSPGSGGKGGGANQPGNAFPGASVPPVKLSATVPTRVLHPDNGVFDVVVVQSNALSGIDNSAGILSGRPVYTVYLKVGTPKNWMMQYCVPGETMATQTAAGVVSLSNPSPVKAPFPRITEIPAADKLPVDKNVTFHGFLETDGQFRDLRVVGADPAGVGPDILRSLGTWLFRPATRDGRPIRVEMVMVAMAR